jgi:uncharacterized membrane protein YuzA (DUF378 family)
MFRRLKTLLLAVALAGCIVPAVVSVTASAQEVDVFKQACDSAQGAGKGSEACTVTGADTVTGTNGVLAKATRLISYLAGISAIILLVIAGIQYITSQGDAGGVSAAKKTVIYALVGLFVVVVAQSIVVFVLNRI